MKYIFTQKDLNLRKRRWLELIKDYGLTIQYQYSKVNVAANALSRKSFRLSCIHLTSNESLIWDIKKLQLEVISPINQDLSILTQMVIQPSLQEKKIEILEIRSKIFEVD